jgi:hypothetical protein
MRRLAPALAAVLGAGALAAPAAQAASQHPRAAHARGAHPRAVTLTSTAAALDVVLDEVTGVVTRLEDLGNGRAPAPTAHLSDVLRRTLAALLAGHR